MFFRLGRGVVRHPWLVIGIWIVAAVAIVGLAPKLATSSSESSFLPSHYQSVQAQNLQQSAFPTAAAPGAIVVFERADGGKLTAADSSLVDSIAGKLTADHIPTLSTMTGRGRRRRTSSSRRSRFRYPTSRAISPRRRPTPSGHSGLT